ncbi:MFS transporter [Streptomyces thinghirensis]|nr:MFS transporter [Streptomyces thinghirensis]
MSALGGLLFGYDTGIISGALLYLREDLGLSSRGQEIVVSVILVGAMVGALCSGRLAGRFGRRRVILWVAAVFGAGALGAALAPGTGTLIAARFVLGLAVGGASNMVPVYIAELAPAAIRGRLMVLFQLMVAIGQLIAYLCGWLFAGSGGWRIMFGLAVIPAVVLAVGMLRLPESPRWLVEHGHEDVAKAVLRRLRPRDADVAAEISSIREVSVASPRADRRALTRPLGPAGPGRRPGRGRLLPADRDQRGRLLRPRRCSRTPGSATRSRFSPASASARCSSSRVSPVRSPWTRSAGAARCSASYRCPGWP